MEGESSVSVNCMFCNHMFDPTKINEDIVNFQQNVEVYESFVREMKLGVDAGDVSKFAASTCEVCFQLMGSLVGSKIEADREEGKVRGLQKEVLGSMRNLDTSLGKFHTELNGLDSQIKRGDAEVAASSEEGLESGSCSQNSIGLRNKILNKIDEVIQELTEFREDLKTKVIIIDPDSENFKDFLKFKENEELLNTADNSVQISPEGVQKQRNDDDDGTQGQDKSIIAKAKVHQIAAVLPAVSPSLAIADKSSVAAVAISIPVIPGLKGRQKKSEEISKVDKNNSNDAIPIIPGILGLTGRKRKSDDISKSAGSNGTKKDKLWEPEPQEQVDGFAEEDSDSIISIDDDKKESDECRSFNRKMFKRKCTEPGHSQKQQKLMLAEPNHAQRHSETNPTRQLLKRTKNKVLTEQHPNKKRRNTRNLRSSRRVSISSSSDDDLFIPVAADSLDKCNKKDEEAKQEKEAKTADPKLKMLPKLVLSPVELTNNEQKKSTITAAAPAHAVDIPEAGDSIDNGQKTKTVTTKVIYFGDTTSSSSSSQQESEIELTEEDFDNDSDGNGVTFDEHPVSKWKERIIRGLVGKQWFLDKEMPKADPKWKVKHRLNYINGLDKMTFGDVPILFNEDDKVLRCGFNKKCSYQTCHREGEFFKSITNHIARVHLGEEGWANLESGSASSTVTATSKTKVSGEWNPTWENSNSEDEAWAEEEDDEQVVMVESPIKPQNKTVKKPPKKTTKGRPGRKSKKSKVAAKSTCKDQHEDNQKSNEQSEPKIVYLKDEEDKDKSAKQQKCCNSEGVSQDDSAAMLKCPVCQKTFISERELRRHHWDHHGEIDEIWRSKYERYGRNQCHKYEGDKFEGWRGGVSKNQGNKSNEDGRSLPKTGTIGLRGKIRLNKIPVKTNMSSYDSDDSDSETDGSNNSGLLDI